MVWATKFQPRKSGDCCDCRKFTDEFDRGDSTDLGGAWTEVGDWSILDEQLKEASGSGLLLTAEKFGLPQFVYATIISSATGKKYRIIVHYYEDLDGDQHYLYAQAEWTSSSAVTVSLHRYDEVDDVGTDTTLETVNWTSFASGDDYQFKVCVEGTETNGHFHARLGSSLLIGDAWCAITFSASLPPVTQVGLATVSISPADFFFDSFHLETRNCTAYCQQVTCLDCFARCDNFHLPRIVHVTAIGHADADPEPPFPPPCPGCDFELEFDLTWDYVSRRWDHSTPWTFCAASWSETFYLDPQEETCINGIDAWLFGQTGSGGWQATLMDDSTCDPLNLHYQVTGIRDGQFLAYCCDTPPGPYCPALTIDFYVTE